CLAKDPKQRVRDIGDVALEIDAVDQVLPETADAPIAPAAAGKSKTAWLPWIAVAAIGLGVGAWEFRRPVSTQDSPLANAQFSRFTDWEGTEAGAEISPDGKFVAFIADRDGRLDLWVSQVGTGRFLNLTKDRPPLSAPNAILRTLGFSGD